MINDFFMVVSRDGLGKVERKGFQHFYDHFFYQKIYL